MEERDSVMLRVNFSEVNLIEEKTGKPLPSSVTRAIIVSEMLCRTLHKSSDEPQSETTEYIQPIRCLQDLT